MILTLAIKENRHWKIYYRIIFIAVEFVAERDCLNEVGVKTYCNNKHGKLLQEIIEPESAF